MARRTLDIGALLIALLMAALAFHAWLASRDEQHRLASTLAAQKQLLEAADLRERAREATLHDTLAQIEKLKRTTRTPAQILGELPQYLSLPEPITLVRPANAAPDAEKGTTPSENNLMPPAEPPSSVIGSSDLPSAPVAQIPAADLKPLYDFVQDCRACQAQLAVARENAADDAAKLAALTRQRDAAITAAKGGSFWHRLRRNTFWFIVGAGVGAAGGYAATK